jgi:DNA-binding response OmpR family regulator
MPARILVLDDEPVMRALIARALGEEGYALVLVADGLRGWSAAAAGEFDLVITNDCMPDMSGTDLIERLRRLFPRLPILHLDDLSRPFGDQFPLDVPTLYKPFGIAALKDAVRKLLRGEPRMIRAPGSLTRGT